MNEDEGESSVASVEEQLKKEMTVYEVWLLVISDSLFFMFTAIPFSPAPISQFSVI
jgi:hypothetical protein